MSIHSVPSTLRIETSEISPVFGQEKDGLKWLQEGLGTFRKEWRVLLRKGDTSLGRIWEILRFWPFDHLSLESSFRLLLSPDTQGWGWSGHWFSEEATAAPESGRDNIVKIARATMENWPTCILWSGSLKLLPCSQMTFQFKDGFS